MSVCFYACLPVCLSVSHQQGIQSVFTAQRLECCASNHQIVGSTPTRSGMFPYGVVLHPYISAVTKAEDEQTGQESANSKEFNFPLK